MFTSRYRFPGMSKEISQLDNNIIRYNQETDLFIKDTISKISDQLQKHAKVVDTVPSPEGEIHISRVMDFLINYWWFVIENCKRSNKSCAIIITEIEGRNSNTTVLEGRLDDELVDMIRGVYGQERGFIKKMSADKESEIISILESYKKNCDIISKLIEITNKQTKLIQESKEISGKCKKVSDLITKGKYKTKVRFCCLDETFLKNV